MSLANLTQRLDTFREAYPLDVVRDVRFYSLGFIIPFGLITNTISAAVFSRRHMRRTTPGLYFLSVALADNVILIGELLLWLNRWDSNGYRFGFNLLGTSEVMCKCVNFLRYTGRLWSSWLVVAISIERFITIVFPFSVHKYSSVTKARIVILSILLVSAGLCSTAFVAIGHREYKKQVRCLILESYLEFYQNWQMACLIAGEMFIPSILVTIFTVLIVWKLTRGRKSNILRRDTHLDIRRRSKERQPTISLIAIAITFVTLRLPYIIAYQLYNNYQLGHGNPDYQFQIFSAYSITFIFAVMNYSVNFWLYFAFGSTFRYELLQCVLCRRTVFDPQSSSTYRGASLYSQYGRGSLYSHHQISMSVDSSPILTRIKRLHRGDNNSL